MPDFSADEKPHEYTPGLPISNLCACGKRSSEIIHKYGLLPSLDLQEGMFRFVEQGYMPGHFLTAMLTNDLFGALTRADQQNLDRIVEIASWIYQYVDNRIYGTPERVRAHHEKFWPR